MVRDCKPGQYRWGGGIDCILSFYSYKKVIPLIYYYIISSITFYSYSRILFLELFPFFFSPQKEKKKEKEKARIKHTYNLILIQEESRKEY
nr:MAG TPA: hypothetical protein [Caudoviricetes sp.]